MRRKRRKNNGWGGKIINQQNERKGERENKSSWSRRKIGRIRRGNWEGRVRRKKITTASDPTVKELWRGRYGSEAISERFLDTPPHVFQKDAGSPCLWHCSACYELQHRNH